MPTLQHSHLTKILICKCSTCPTQASFSHAPDHSQWPSPAEATHQLTLRSWTLTSHGWLCPTCSHRGA